MSQGYSYSKDLWDCLSCIQDRTQSNVQTMKSLRSFFQTYRSALETFSKSLSKAALTYEKEVIFKGSKNPGDNVLVDSLSAALGNVKMCLDEMTRGLSEQADQVLRELVEPIEAA